MEKTLNFTLDNRYETFALRKIVGQTTRLSGAYAEECRSAGKCRKNTTRVSEDYDEIVSREYGQRVGVHEKR